MKIVASDMTQHLREALLELMGFLFVERTERIYHGTELCGGAFAQRERFKRVRSASAQSGIDGVNVVGREAVPNRCHSGLQADDMLHGIHCGVERGKLTHAENPVWWEGLELKRESRKEGERSLRAHQ